MLKKANWEEFLRASSPQYYLLLVSSAAGRANLTGISWYTIVSWDPRMVAVSLRRERFGYELLRQNGDFTLAFPSPGQTLQAIRCGRVSGRDCDKVAETGLRLLPAPMVRGFLLDGAAAALECRMEQEVTAGDHQLILAQVLQCHADPTDSAHLYTTGYREFYSLNGGNFNAVRG